MRTVFLSERHDERLEQVYRAVKGRAIPYHDLSNWLMGIEAEVLAVLHGAEADGAGFFSPLTLATSISVRASFDPEARRIKMKVFVGHEQVELGLERLSDQPWGLGTDEV